MEVIDKMKLQKATFGNPIRIITNKEKAFTESDLNDIVQKEKLSI